MLQFLKFTDQKYSLFLFSKVERARYYIEEEKNGLLDSIIRVQSCVGCWEDVTIAYDFAASCNYVIFSKTPKVIKTLNSLIYGQPGPPIFLWVCIMCLDLNETLEKCLMLLSSIFWETIFSQHDCEYLGLWKY